MFLCGSHPLSSYTVSVLDFSLIDGYSLPVAFSSRVLFFTVLLTPGGPKLDGSPVSGYRGGSRQRACIGETAAQCCHRCPGGSCSCHPGHPACSHSSAVRRSGQEWLRGREEGAGGRLLQSSGGSTTGRPGEGIRPWAQTSTGQTQWEWRWCGCRRREVRQVTLQRHRHSQRAAPPRQWRWWGGFEQREWAPGGPLLCRGRWPRQPAHERWQETPVKPRSGQALQIQLPSPRSESAAPLPPSWGQEAPGGPGPASLQHLCGQWGLRGECRLQQQQQWGQWQCRCHVPRIWPVLRVRLPDWEQVQQTGKRSGGAGLTWLSADPQFCFALSPLYLNLLEKSQSAFFLTICPLPGSRYLSSPPPPLASSLLIHPCADIPHRTPRRESLNTFLSPQNSCQCVRARLYVCVSILSLWAVWRYPAVTVCVCSMSDISPLFSKI